jgi:hypothetical protein
MTYNLIERRVIGALRLQDAATGAMIRRALKIDGLGVQLQRNLSGLYVITAAPGFDEYIHSFLTPPKDPPLGSVTITLTIRDPLGHYLARRQSLVLPRDPNPALAHKPESLFQALPVVLFPTAIAPLQPGWAIVRATVKRPGANGVGLADALLRVERSSDQTLLATGLSDSRGEALVAIPGIAAFMTSDDNQQVLTTKLAATITAFVEPTAAQPSPLLPEPLPPDPNDLENRRATLRRSSAAISLSSGRTTTVVIEMNLN